MRDNVTCFPFIAEAIKVKVEVVYFMLMEFEHNSVIVRTGCVDAEPTQLEMDEVEGKGNYETSLIGDLMGGSGSS